MSSKIVGGSRQAPLRLSSVFGRMLTDCPAQVAAYGKCISDNLDHLQKDACAKEFGQMKQCAQKALTAARAARGR